MLPIANTVFTSRMICRLKKGIRNRQKTGILKALKSFPDAFRPQPKQGPKIFYSYDIM